MQSGLLLPRQPLRCANSNKGRHRTAVVCIFRSDKETLDGFARRCLSVGLAASISLSTLFGISSTDVGFGGRRAQAAGELSESASVEQKYEQQVSHRHPRSHLPSSDEAATLQLLVDRDLFTDDAWQGMIK